MLNASQATFALTGEFFYSDAESDVIPTATSVIPAGWKGLGYHNADGWTDSNSISETTEYAWQNNDALNTFVSEPVSQISMNLVQRNLDVVEFVYNTEVSEDGSYTVDPAAPLIRRSIIGNITDGTRAWRIWLPSATARINGDVQHVSTSTTVYPVIITAYKRVISNATYGPKVIMDPALATPSGD